MARSKKNWFLSFHFQKFLMTSFSRLSKFYLNLYIFTNRLPKILTTFLSFVQISKCYLNLYNIIFTNNPNRFSQFSPSFLNFFLDAPFSWMPGAVKFVSLTFYAFTPIF